MKRTRHTPEQIVRKLREADAALSAGASIGQVCQRLGVSLLDLVDPSKVIAQCPEFIITPRTDYERAGDVPNCIFSNGAIVEVAQPPSAHPPASAYAEGPRQPSEAEQPKQAELDGEVKVYYGACDTSICLATTTLDELVSACRGEL